jgi:co-chaperonin GroES (HSP10)
MDLQLKERDLERMMVVGDRVLIRPMKSDEKTRSGLFLPPGVQEKEPLQSGYILKTGPGYPLPLLHDEDEPWKNDSSDPKYLPLQAKPGDLAIYLQNNGFEIELNRQKYIVVPHSALLLIVRDDETLY